MRFWQFPLAFLLWTGLGAASVSGWTLLQIDGRDYVPLSEVEKFYEFTLRSGNFEEVRLVKPNTILVAPIGTRTLFLNTLRFHLSLPVHKQGGVAYVSRLDLATVIDPVLRPGHIPSAPVQTIIIDPGHGGNDQGTASTYGTEKAYALDVARRLAPKLRSAGLNVVFTRTDDTYVSLEDRVRMANQHPNALFLSLHFNAGTGRGIETFILTPLGVPSTDQAPSLLDFQFALGNECDLENIALATAIHGRMMRGLHLPDRGIRRARFHVLKGLQIPGVLIEGGYLGGQDASLIHQRGYREKLADCIAVGIRRYRLAIPQNRPRFPSEPLANQPTEMVQSTGPTPHEP